MKGIKCLYNQKQSYRKQSCNKAANLPESPQYRIELKPTIGHTVKVKGIYDGKKEQNESIVICLKDVVVIFHSEQLQCKHIWIAITIDAYEKINPESKDIIKIRGISYEYAKSGYKNIGIKPFSIKKQKE